MNFGDRLKAAREEAGLTQRELGQLAGVPNSTIGSYENGLREKPNTEILNKLAKALNVDKNYLLVGVVNKESIVDDFIESLYNQGIIKGTELDDNTRDMILKVVEAKIIRLEKNNK